jgi:hypothetical protein
MRSILSQLLENIQNLISLPIKQSRASESGLFSLQRPEWQDRREENQDRRDGYTDMVHFGLSKASRYGCMPQNVKANSL